MFSKPDKDTSSQSVVLKDWWNYMLINKEQSRNKWKCWLTATVSPVQTCEQSMQGTKQLLTAILSSLVTNIKTEIGCSRKNNLFYFTFDNSLAWWHHCGFWFFYKWTFTGQHCWSGYIQCAKIRCERWQKACLLCQNLQLVALRKPHLELKAIRLCPGQKKNIFHSSYWVVPSAEQASKREEGHNEII